MFGGYLSPQVDRTLKAMNVRKAGHMRHYRTCPKKTTHLCGNPFHYCAALPLQTKLRKTQMQLWKICRRNCTVFLETNVFVSDLRCSCATNAHTEKYSERWHHFLDTYHRFRFVTVSDVKRKKAIKSQTGSSRTSLDSMQTFLIV